MMFQIFFQSWDLFSTGFMFVSFSKYLLSVCWLDAVENTEMAEKYLLLC